jgi:hypothetical protein
LTASIGLHLRALALTCSPSACSLEVTAAHDDGLRGVVNATDETLDIVNKHEDFVKRVDEVA